MITQLTFAVFSVVLVLSAGMVVGARNPVHAVLFLILAFFNAAGLFLIAGAEFLAMILVIVYVGAVAVLFLFVVMMLDIELQPTREGFQRYAPVGLAVGLVLLAEVGIAVGRWQVAPDVRALPHANVPDAPSNTAALGQLIYTDYIFLFQACGLVLLVAMVGAIVLTLRDRPVAKRQVISRQHARVPADTLQMMSLGLGASTAQNGGFLRPTGIPAALPLGETAPLDALPAATLPAGTLPPGNRPSGNRLSGNLPTGRLPVEKREG